MFNLRETRKVQDILGSPRFAPGCPAIYQPKYQPGVQADNVPMSMKRGRDLVAILREICENKDTDGKERDFGP